MTKEKSEESGVDQEGSTARTETPAFPPIGWDDPTHHLHLRDIPVVNLSYSYSFTKEDVDGLEWRAFALRGLIDRAPDECPTDALERERRWCLDLAERIRKVIP